MIERERDGSAIGLVISGLLLLCGDSYHHGQWDEAKTLAQQGLDLAAAHGYHLLQGHLRCLLALIAAARGEADLANTMTDAITIWAAPRAVGLTQALARRARTIAALAQGDYEDAYLQASQVNPPGTPPSGDPGRWMVMDLVEAAIRTGRTEEARVHVAAIQQAGAAHASTRIALISAGAAAMAAPHDEAGPMFETALSLPEADRWPFVHARIRLAYGEWLRRTRNTTRARPYLRAALETFDRLGAGPRAGRARNELRAMGVSIGQADRLGVESLTPQQREIAMLAAGGMTNKQIGERLFVSSRTVGYHLYQIFPKLGVTTRAALRDALTA